MASEQIFSPHPEGVQLTPYYRYYYCCIDHKYTFYKVFSADLCVNTPRICPSGDKRCSLLMVAVEKYSESGKILISPNVADTEFNIDPNVLDDCDFVDCKNNVISSTDIKPAKRNS